jgi:hypothetical protein
MILHYERVTESKFEAFHDTLLGKMVIENAEIAVIQVNSDLPMPPWQKGQQS